MSAASKKGVIWRTYTKRVDDSYQLQSEERLVDDPANGVRDYSKWRQKYAAFEGKRRAPRKKRVRKDDDTPWMTLSRHDDPLPTEVLAAARLNDAQAYEAEAAYEELLGKSIVPLVVNRIHSGALPAEYEMDAFDAARHAVLAAYAKYDAERPPKKREGVSEKDVHSASLKTFLMLCVRHAISDLVRQINSDKGGGWLQKCPISNAVENVEPGRISAEVIPADAKYDIKTVDFCNDCASVRMLISKLLGSRFLEVFDRRMDEEPDSHIYADLKVTAGVFKTRFLRPIQRLVAMHWIEPNTPERDWK